jgi:hypothetical protein
LVRSLYAGYNTDPWLRFLLQYSIELSYLKNTIDSGLGPLKLALWEEIPDPSKPKLL